MVKRLLDAVASDFELMTADELAESIRLAEGRTLAAEVICSAEPPVEGISQGELVSAMGADIVVLDQYDPFMPRITGVDSALLSDRPLFQYRRMLGRPIGVNMISADARSAELLGGRLVSDASVSEIVAQGAQILFLYSRPRQGGTPALQAVVAGQIKQMWQDHILVVGVPTFSNPAPRDSESLRVYADEIKALLDAGCDGVGLPMPGSKQGWQADKAAALVDVVHQQRRLAWLFVTGSVEGAPSAVMHDLALTGKHLGADAFRLDEAGLSGMPPAENVMAFSMALRGARHTYRRIASSVRR
jgi:hypothetical protein